MKKLLPILALLMVFACDNDETTTTDACHWDQPYTQIPWVASLKASMTNCTCEPAIIQGTYNGQVVIFVALTETQLCDYIWTPTLYNCQGDVVRVFTSSQSDQNDLYEKVTRDVVLVRCSD